MGELVSGSSHDPRIHRSLAQRPICQIRRRDVQEWLGADADRNPFPDRDQDEIIIPPTSYERSVIEAVEVTTSRSSRAPGKAAVGPPTQRTGRCFTSTSALSSPEALRQSLRNRKDSLQPRLQEELGIAE
jgi:hypothetical protein